MDVDSCCPCHHSVDTVLYYNYSYVLSLSFLFCLLYDSAEGEDAFNRPPLIRARCVEAFKLLFVSLPVSY